MAILKIIEDFITELAAPIIFLYFFEIARFPQKYNHINSNSDIVKKHGYIGMLSTVVVTLALLIVFYFLEK